MTDTPPTSRFCKVCAEELYGLAKRPGQGGRGGRKGLDKYTFHAPLSPSLCYLPPALHCPYFPCIMPPLQMATREPFSMSVPGNPARFWAGVLCALAVPKDCKTHYPSSLACRRLYYPTICRHRSRAFRCSFLPHSPHPASLCCPTLQAELLTSHAIFQLKLTMKTTAPTSAYPHSATLTPPFLCCHLKQSS